MSAIAKLAHRRVAALLLATIVGAGLPGLSHSASPARAQQAADPAAVLQTYADAVNGGDAAGAAATFTDNAMYVSPFPAGACSRQSPCIDRPAIRPHIDSQIADHQCRMQLDTDVFSNVVIGHLEDRSDSIRAVGLEHNEVVHQPSTFADAQGRCSGLSAIYSTGPATVGYACSAAA